MGNETKNSNVSKNVEETPISTKNIYIGIRYLEGICIAVFLFGSLWESTEILKLTLPQFLMLYGGAGAVISELMARFTLGRIKKKAKEIVD